MEKILRDYDQPNTLLTITSYPDKNNFNAIAWHSKKTLKPLAKNHKVLICAEIINDRKAFKINNNLLLSRVWKKGQLSSFIYLFLFINSFRRIKNIYIQFEFNIFGGIIPNLLVLFLLFLLRLFGKSITFELHQVIVDIKDLVKHINITSFFWQKFFNFGLKVFYIITAFIANKIIVFEEELKKRLPFMINKQKVQVLSLSVEKKPTIEISQAKKSLGLDPKYFVILIFGFINGYKGIDWVIKIMSKLKINRIKLLIAGGANPYLKNKPYYKNYYNSILNKIKNNPRIKHFGFVPDESVSLYFSASDLVILPYTVFMSASGPFSLALSYGRPFLLSEKLSAYTESHDFAETMNKISLSKQDIFFKLKVENFSFLLNKSQKDKIYYDKLTSFTLELARLRSSKYIIKNLERILFNSSFKPQPLFNKSFAKMNFVISSKARNLAKRDLI